jgi:hypothetical protein
MTTWSVGFSFSVINTFFTTFGTFDTVNSVIEVVWFTWTGWRVDSVWFTDNTVSSFLFTVFTFSVTVDNDGGTDGDSFDMDGFGISFWNNTEWWVD